MRRQAMLAPVDMANDEERKGGGHQAPPAQWPGQGDGLLLPANIQGAINNRQAHQRCPKGGPTVRGAGCGRSRSMRRAVKQYSCPATRPTPRKTGGSDIKQPPVQWPGQGDGLPLLENMQGTLTNRQAHQRCPTGGPTTRGAGCGRSRIMRRAVRHHLRPLYTANAEEARGGKHQATPAQCPRQGDGLPLPENMQGALGLQVQQPTGAPGMYPTGGPTTREAGVAGAEGAQAPAGVAGGGAAHAPTQKRVRTAKITGWEVEASPFTKPCNSTTTCNWMICLSMPQRRLSANYQKLLMPNSRLIAVVSRLTQVKKGQCHAT